MRFRVADEKVLNSYGFRIITEGIDIGDFLENPIMLYEHNTEAPPIGIWANLVKANGEMTAEPIFDEQDEDAVKIMNKCKKGIIKMSSIGVIPLAWSEAPEDMIEHQEMPTLLKCKLKEISLTPFGAVKTAVMLYDDKGKILKLNDSEIKDYIKQSMNNNFNFNTGKQMEKNQFVITLSAALGLGDLTEADLLKHVIGINNENVKLKSDNKTLVSENEALKTNAENAEKEAILQKAVDEKKITHKEKEVYLKLSIADIKEVVGSKAPAVNLNGFIAGRQKSIEDLATMSWKELDEKGKLTELKESNFELFKEKFKAEFGKEYVLTNQTTK
jgi:hypothetical protein